MRQVSFWQLDDSGVTDAAADWSAANANVFIMRPLQAAKNEIFDVHQVTLTIEATDTTLAQFGGVDLAAGTGLGLNLARYLDTSAVQDSESLIADIALKDINDLVRAGAEVTVFNEGANTPTIQAKFSFDEPIVLDSRNGDLLAIPLADNLATLDALTILASVEKRYDTI